MKKDRDGQTGNPLEEERDEWRDGSMENQAQLMVRRQMKQKTTE